MSVAALYDIHGNLPALDAVLHEVARVGVTQLVIGGDVLPGPMPSECLRRLRALEIPLHFIRGNGDRESLTHRDGGGTTTLPEQARAALCWSGEQLTDEEAAFVATWPLTLRLDVQGFGNVLFCHATPRNDTDIFVADTPEAPLIPLFANEGASVVVCGHTHIPFDRRVGGVRVVNAGSVGMPIGEVGAPWLLFGSTLEHRLTKYDLESAAVAVRATSFPGRDHFAENNVLTSPSKDAMRQMYARVQLR